MCGRTSLFLPEPELSVRFDAAVAPNTAYRPRYNVAPGDPLEVVTAARPDEIARARWGLLPPWAEDPSDGHPNARAETAHERAAFRESWAERPCLVLSSGYYEWADGGAGPSQPHRVYRPDDPAFAMAGLWRRWAPDDDAESLATVTVLTTEATGAIADVHDRMPVVLRRADERRWLTADPAERRDLCRRSPGDDLAVTPVTTRVNDPANDDPSLLERPETEQRGLDEFV